MTRLHHCKQYCSPRGKGEPKYQVQRHADDLHEVTTAEGVGAIGYVERNAALLRTAHELLQAPRLARR